MEFKVLDKSHKDIFHEYLSADFCNNEVFTPSENIFENLFVWSGGNIKIHTDSNAIYIFVKYNDEEFFFPPISKSKQGFIKAVENIFLYFESINEKIKIKCLSECMISTIKASNILRSNYSITLDEPNGEYYYNASDLATYSGKKFNKKRNHVNKFNKLYSYSVIPYSKEYYEKVVELNRFWALESHTASGWEHNALLRFLDNYEFLDGKGTLIMVGDKLIAFAFGIITKIGVGIEMFEKANTDYDGAYSVICHEFCKMYFSDTKYVNRQEDMGIAGLRQSKLSYYPVIVANEYILKEC